MLTSKEALEEASAATLGHLRWPKQCQLRRSSRGVGELRSLNYTIFEAMPIEEKLSMPIEDCSRGGIRLHLGPSSKAQARGRGATLPQPHLGPSSKAQAMPIEDYPQSLPPSSRTSPPMSLWWETRMSHCLWERRDSRREKSFCSRGMSFSMETPYSRHKTTGFETTLVWPDVSQIP